MRIRTILTAAAAPAALAAVLLGTAGQASAATTASAPSAYFWQPNGHALTGPQDTSNGVSLANGYLAKVVVDEHNANITGKTITITGTIKGGLFKDQPNAGDSPQNPPSARVYFAGGSAGTNDGSPNGYMSQSWWANAQVVDLNATASGDTQISISLPVDTTDWSNWNGQHTSDPNENAQPLFAAAESHVRDLGLSFGGGYYFENGVNGPGSLIITSITVG
jgi:hypothetical protein